MPLPKLIIPKLGIVCLCLHALALGPSFCYGENACSSSPECSDAVHFSRTVGTDSRTALRAAFLVRGKADDVYQALRDAEKFPEFMPGTDEVQILENAEDHQIVSFKGSSGLFKAEVVLRRVADDRQRLITWSLVRGSLKSSDGFWAVETDSLCGASLVTYSNTIASKMPVPTRLVHSFLRGSIENTAVNLRRRIASGGVWQSEEYRRRKEHRQ